MNGTLRTIYKKFTLFLGTVFFDKRYLKNKWFQDSPFGMKWIWRSIRHQVFGRENKHIPWPVSHYITINGPKENIIFSPDDIDNFQGKGIYFQCEKGKIVIGRGTLIANNTAFITANHDPNDIKKHLEGKDIVIGDDCWIGINAVILPGVVLGDNTVVGAGTISK